MPVNNPIAGLNKIFDNRIRLGVMSIVMVNDEISFNDLKQLLEVTDGNLATHLQTLEEVRNIKNPIDPGVWMCRLSHDPNRVLATNPTPARAATLHEQNRSAKKHASPNPR